MKIPFSAASHTFRLPKVSSSLALSLPLKTTTVVFGSLLSEAMLLYTVGLTRVIACKPQHHTQMLFIHFILYLTVWGVEPVVTHQTSWLESTGVGAVQVLFRCSSDAVQMLFKYALLMMLLPSVQLSVCAVICLRSKSQNSVLASSVHC